VTAQASDIVIYKGGQFNLAAYSNGEPFDPSKHGYKPVMASTACWRGYLCKYKIENGRLLLDKLHINHQESNLPVSKKEQPPNLNSSVASVSKQSFLGLWLFEDVNLPLDYSGGLIVARGFIRSLYVHMGFQPIWKYEVVHELIFNSGELQTESDLSSRMAEIREKTESETTENGEKPSRKEIDMWINESFRRDYKR
jgi:hypothetical protein